MKFRVAIPRRRPAPHTRGDIQGLRALAVSLVIANHVVDQPVGGFVGVDIFFVVSGFLITGLLVSERERHGRVSFVDFYRRRVRRIVPAATLVLVATVVATYALFDSTRGDDVARDAGWSFVFAANWHFLELDTNYFSSFAPVSPLQHYWSLSVEEQFYLVWPALLVLLFWLGRRRWVVAGGTAAIIGASFGYSMHHSTSDPVGAYFSTFDRAWELGLGALLALAVPRLERTPAWLRTVLAYAGLALIAAGVMLVSEQSRFPAPWAALAVGGTALVIAAGIGAQPRFLAPLSNGITRYLGDISYSLYLWHFPVVVLALAYFPDAGLAYQLVCVATTLLMSMLTYHLVEEPVRHSNWLEPRWRRIRGDGPANHSRGVANGWLTVGLIATVLLCVAVVQKPDTSGTVQVLAETPSAIDASAPADGAPLQPDSVVDGELNPATAYLQRRISQSLAFDDFPDLNPQVGSLTHGAGSCTLVGPAELDACQFGTAAKGRTVAVLGDSMAIAYMPSIRAALESAALIQQLTLPECPPFDAATLRFSGAAFPECPEFRSWSRSLVAETDPDLVIVASSYVYPSIIMASGETGTAALDEVRAGWISALSDLARGGRFVVVLASPPGSENLQACFSKVSSPSDCEGEITEQWFDFTDVQREAAETVGVQFIDSTPWFCVDRFCPAFVGRTPTYADGTHVSTEYAREIGPAVLESLLDAGAAYAAAKKQPAAAGSSRSGSGPR